MYRHSCRFSCLVKEPLQRAQSQKTSEAKGLGWLGVWGPLWAWTHGLGLWISLRSKLILQRLGSGSGWVSVPHTVFDCLWWLRWCRRGDTIWSYPPTKVFFPLHFFISDYSDGIGSLPVLYLRGELRVHATKASVVLGSHCVQFSVS